MLTCCYICSIMRLFLEGDLMKTYNVKQIAEMLHTNPETVRRWIRDKKMGAVQVSKKTGNIVTETDLLKFIKSTPKYLPHISAGVASISPVVGIAALAGGIVTGVLLSYIEETKKTNVEISADDLKTFIKNNIRKLEKAISQKQTLIQETEKEIGELSQQIKSYQNLLDHEELLLRSIDNQY